MPAPSSSSSLRRLHLPASASLALIAALIQYPTAAHAYSWNYKNSPSQCGDTTIEITGTDGVPPYRALIIPYGPSPLTNREVRMIMDVPFDEGATSVSFKLKYPSHSQLVAVVSDATGFGTGGTSVATQVQETDDNSCYDADTNSVLAWTFDISPRNQITQCGDTRLLWYNKGDPVGTPQFYGVIPGGNSFNISGGPITDEPGLGTGFTWKANVRVGTTLMIVGGDDRNPGSAGSAFFLVANPSDGDGSCLDENSPSSTPGTPAGGSYPTGSSPGNSGSSDDAEGGGSNIGAIVGGVVAGVVVIVAAFLALFFYRRRKRALQRQREKPDLLTEEDDEEEDSNRASRNDLPQFYRPEPFTVPDPSMYGDAQTEDGRRPLSGTGTSFYTRSATPDGTVALGGASQAGGMGMAPSSTGAGRKGQPRMMRPVNIIQHDDAGPSGPPPPRLEEADTIELPPAYTAIRTDSNQT